MPDFYTWVILLINQSEEIGENQLLVVGSRGDQSPLMHVALCLLQDRSICLLCCCSFEFGCCCLSFLLMLAENAADNVVCLKDLLHPHPKASVWQHSGRYLVDERCHIAFVEEDHNKIPILYWLPNFIKDHLVTLYCWDRTRNPCICSQTRICRIPMGK